LSEFQTRQIIQQLIKLGLVIRTSFNGRVRELSTPWTSLKLNDQHADSLKTNSETVEKPTCRLLKNQQTESTVLRAEKQSRIDKLSKQENKTNCMSGAEPRKHNGFLDLNGIDQSSKEYIWFDKLRTAVRHSRTLEHQRNINDKKWINEFQQLLIETNNDYERIDKALEWYLPKMGKVSIGKIFIPQIFSAAAF